MSTTKKILIADDEPDILEILSFNLNGEGYEVITAKNGDEAMMVLEKFVDNALMTNANSLRVLHGKGDGVLRKVVRQKLREYGNNITNIYHPEPDGGGDGVTIVELA